MIEFLKTYKAAFIIILIIGIGGSAYIALRPLLHEVLHESANIPVPLPYDPDSDDNPNPAGISISDLRINSVSDDKINYYVSYSYKTKAQGSETGDVTIVQSTLTASKDIVTKTTLSIYVSKSLGVQYEGVNEADVKEQVEDVLDTKTWDAPPDPEWQPTGSSSGGSSGGGSSSGGDSSGGSGSTGGGSSGGSAGTGGSGTTPPADDADEYPVPPPIDPDAPVYATPADVYPTPIDINNENSPEPPPQ